MLETSQTMAKLAAALSKAQAEVEGAVKGKVNPAFKSKYADLSSVWEACREALTKNELSVIQSPGEVVDGKMHLTTMLLHSSGEWVKGLLTIPLGKVDAQAYGSATTYARRYALAAFVGVAPDDDDGNAATKAAPANETRAPASPASTVSRKTPAQAKRDGDDVRYRETIDQLDPQGVREWRQHFDRLTATCPPQWLDSIRDRLTLREEELESEARAREASAELDAGFSGTIHEGGSGGLANSGNRLEAAE